MGDEADLKEDEEALDAGTLAKSTSICRIATRVQRRATENDPSRERG